MHEHKPDFRKAQYVRKAQQIAELSDRLSRANGAILVECRGMKVKETTDLRNRLRKVNAEMNVAKNTLIQRATTGQKLGGLDEYFVGPTAVVFAYDDTVAAVKALTDFTRECKLLTLKAANLGGSVFDADQLKDIAKLPPREQIMGQLIGSIQAPAANLVGMVQAPISQLVFTLQAIGEKANSEVA